MTTVMTKTQVLLFLATSLVLAVNSQETTTTATTTNRICMIQYLLADNNLESFLRQDLQEWIESPILQDSASSDATTKLTNWIYFDGRNLKDGNREVIREPLPNVWWNNEQLLSEVRDIKHEGSYYLTYKERKMMVNTTLNQEQDGDDPTVLQNFVETVIDDCVDKTGADEELELFVVFSSHGSGFVGFGGDENPKRKRQQRQRQLIQSNREIATALQTALNNISGSPKHYTVIGFDACFMQGMGVVDDYTPLTKYVLASESLEPGHGWSYSKLQLPPSTRSDAATNSSASLELAKQIVDQYIEDPQSRRRLHRTPKLLSIVNTSHYTQFVQSWDDLCRQFVSLLKAGKDGYFLAALHRSRSQALDFPFSALDGGAMIQKQRQFQTETGKGGGKKQSSSALDVGNFLATFLAMCNPQKESQLYNLLSTTATKYNEMFESRRVGQGTMKGTGMHIIWPHRQSYNPKTMDSLLFNENNNNFVQGAPNYIQFLKSYLSTSTTSSTITESVCQFGVGGSSNNNSSSTVNDIIDDDEILLLNPTLNVISESLVTVQSDLVLETDMAIVEYGIDIKSYINNDHHDDNNKRKRQRLLQQRTSRSSNNNNNNNNNNKRRRSLRNRVSSRHGQQRPATRSEAQRKVQQQQFPDEDDYYEDYGSDDYFVLYGGDVQGNYSGSLYQASWNRRFYTLKDKNNAKLQEPIFVYDDDGASARSIPVLYFPSDTEVHQNGYVEFGTSWEEAEDEMGGLYGFLTFSMDPQTQQPMENLILFTAIDNTETSPIQETPKSSSASGGGGSIAPIVFVDGSLGDNDDRNDDFLFDSSSSSSSAVLVDTLVGGFNGTVFPWNENVDLIVSTVTDLDYQTYFGADTIVIDMYAYDFDTSAGAGELEDWISFDVLTSTTTTSNNENENESNNDNDNLDDTPELFESSAYTSSSSSSSSSPAIINLVIQVGFMVLLLGGLHRGLD